jgi:hypothetical protein
MVVKFYYEDVPKEGEKSLAKMQELVVKAMEHVRKEHYLAFGKHLHVCDSSFRPEYL